MAQQNLSALMRIPVTKPFLPPREEFDSYLDKIWSSGWVTNQGKFVSELEEKIALFLGVSHISFTSSGTMGLQLVLHSLPKKGEIITTPFTYAATANSIIWEGFTPVFVDIHPERLTIEVAEIENKITEKTVAILPVHIYGNPCDCLAIDELGEKYKLPIIYDAAHCFGVNFKGKSIFEFGDFSILSTHATKLYNTANGGFVVCKNTDAKKKIDQLKNFGHNGPNTFEVPGINGKNSELHAALGLCNLKYADNLLEKRKQQWNYYFDRLSHSKYSMMEITDPGFNYAYFPVICSTTHETTGLISAGEGKGIELRRYFNPSLDELYGNIENSCATAREISSRIFCLPLYHHITKSEQDEVIKLLHENE